MENRLLSTEETQALSEVLEKVKTSKTYQNYVAGVKLNEKRAISLKGEGDAFAKIGETLRQSKIPAFLNATAKGQQKVQGTLQAELKQRGLSSVLKDETLNETIYRDLYVEPGTLNKFLGISPQEEQMSEDATNTNPVEEEVVQNGEQQEIETKPVEENNGSRFDSSKYDAAFLESDGFKNLGLGETLTEEDAAKLAAAYEAYKEAQKANADGNDGAENGAAEQDAAEQEATEQEAEQPAIEVNSGENDEKTAEPQDQDWVTRYNETLTKYGAANGNIWTRDNEEDENGQRPVGLKGQFANGTEVHYAAENKLSVKTPEGEKPSADHFKEVVALAKDNGQDIKLGDSMSPEFKAALIEACAKGGVTMQGLSNEEQEMYNSFKPKEEAKEDANEVPVRAAEVKDTDENGDPLYKLNARMAEGWLSMYDNKIQKGKLDQEIEGHTRLLAGGAFKVTGEEKATAQLLMMKYAQAMHNGNDAQAEQCVTALQKYGVDTITRDPKPDGKNKVTVKPYAERTPEERSNIEQAAEKVLPKKAQAYDPAVMQAMLEAKGQTRQ